MDWWFSAENKHGSEFGDIGRNEYLRLSTRRGLETERVSGNEPELVGCPVCLYRSLGPPGFFEICDVCSWQNDGVRGFEEVSGANAMSLNEAKARFAERGSIRGIEPGQTLLEDRLSRYMRESKIGLD